MGHGGPHPAATQLRARLGWLASLGSTGRARDPGVLISNMMQGFGELPPKSKPHPTVCLELSGIRVEARSWLVWEGESTPRVCDLPPHSLGHSGGSTRPAPPCSTKDLEKGAGRCLGLEMGPDSCSGS